MTDMKETTFEVYQNGVPYTISVCEEKEIVRGRRYFIVGYHRIPLWVLLVCGICILCVITTLRSHDLFERTSEITIFSKKDINALTSAEINCSVEKNGFVFPDSGSRYLTEADIALLGEGAYEKELLRSAVNELYARHGFAFQNEELEEYYSNLGCEQNCTAEEARNLFNIYEEYNLEYLVEIEHSRGYR